MTDFNHKQASEQQAEPIAFIKQGDDGYPKLVFAVNFTYHSIAAKQDDIPLYTIQPDQSAEIELENEIAELKAELAKQLEIKKEMQVGIVQFVDAIAEYFGKRNPAVIKLLEQVKELR